MSTLRRYANAHPKHERDTLFHVHVVRYTMHICSKCIYIAENG